MRVTPSMMNNSAIRQTQLRNAEILVRQTQLSTGLRIQKPSDDPFAYSAMTGLQRQLSELASEEANLFVAESRLNASVTSLQDVTNILVRAKQIALQANQATDDAERIGLATEVDHLLDRLLQAANAQNAGNYQYSGSSTSSPPFQIQELASSSGGLPQVVYRGSDQPTETIVSASIRIETGRVGSEVFINRERGETVLMGQTGAQPGSGTDSAVGRSSLLLRHSTTTFAAGSGIAAGGSSSEKDTILGPTGVHTLEIHDLAGDGSAGTISLNGGPPVSFTSSDTDLQINGPNGESIFVDTTNITAGFNGSVDLTADGVMSIDGGASFVNLDYSANQALIHAETGAVTYINTSAVTRVGTEHLEYTETADVFTALLELRDDIRNSRQLPPDRLADVFARRIGDLDRGINHIATEIGRESADLEDMKLLHERNRDIQLQLKTSLSEHASVDYAEAVSAMQRSLNLLEFTYRASATILQQSILNHL